MDWMGKIKSSVADRVDDFSGGMAFPASKDELVENARRQHLPPDVIERLERIPDKRYSNISELIKETAKEAL